MPLANHQKALAVKPLGLFAVRDLDYGLRMTLSRPIMIGVFASGLLLGAGIALWQTYGLATIQAYMIAGIMACF
ncbi:MAG: hypothetical protein AAF903_15385 [Pseudomonadota bacterium]